MASRPVRARGLKLGYALAEHMAREVAPRAGAWIETFCAGKVETRLSSRAPCGRVD